MLYFNNSDALGFTSMVQCESSIYYDVRICESTWFTSLSRMSIFMLCLKVRSVNLHGLLQCMLIFIVCFKGLTLHGLLQWLRCKSLGFTSVPGM